MNNRVLEGKKIIWSWKQYLFSFALLLLPFISACIIFADRLRTSVKVLVQETI